MEIKYQEMRAFSPMVNLKELLMEVLLLKLAWPYQEWCGIEITP